MVWFKGKVKSDSDTNSDDEYFAYSKKQTPDEPIQVDFLKSFYGRRRLGTKIVHPTMLWSFIGH